MKSHLISYVDVLCLHSIEEAIEHACEVEKHSYLESTRGMLTYEYVFAEQRPIDLSKEKNSSSDEELYTRRSITLYPYRSKISEYKDFYTCLTDRLMAVVLSATDFTLLHDLINRSDQDSQDGFPSVRLRELVSSISDTLVEASFEASMYSPIKFFSLKTEIIAFIEAPVTKPVIQTFDSINGKTNEAWGFYLKKPSWCLRFKSEIHAPQV